MRCGDSRLGREGSDGARSAEAEAREERVMFISLVDIEPKLL
jgi:hypothetical protein